jgi:NAD(P)-dependent dehydrogenase (short-subunit alcohol dehydrogenase family)
MDLEGKVVFVTGASSGIGRCVALALARAGAKVTLAARTLGALEREVAAIRAAGGRACAVRLDVTDDASAAEALASATAAWGRLDALVNAAGNGGAMGRWEDQPAGLAREQFEVHVLGAERMARAALPALRATRGMVVNFSSTVGFVPMPGAAMYSAAKAAVNALTVALRAELAESGVDVRLFVPPHTSTAAGLAWPLGLPKIFAPEWVADRFVEFLRGGSARAIPGGNGGLLVLQRLSPGSAQRIMNGLGFGALARLRPPAPTIGAAPHAHGPTGSGKFS